MKTVEKHTVFSVSNFAEEMARENEELILQAEAAQPALFGSL